MENMALMTERKVEGKIYVDPKSIKQFCSTAEHEARRWGGGWVLTEKATIHPMIETARSMIWCHHLYRNCKSQDNIKSDDEGKANNLCQMLRTVVNKRHSPMIAALQTAVIKALRNAGELIWLSSRLAWNEHRTHVSIKTLQAATQV